MNRTCPALPVLARVRGVFPLILLVAGPVTCSDDDRSPESEGIGPVDSVMGNPVSEAVRRALGNAEYSGIFEEPVQLIDGEFKGPPFVTGGASRPELTLASDPFAGGDLDGDGNAEYVALLGRSDGGSGTFLYLSVMRPTEDGFASVQAIPVGDRVRVTRLEIQNRRLVAEILTHGSSDPACCPSLPDRRIWEWREGQLWEVMEVQALLIPGMASGAAGGDGP